MPFNGMLTFRQFNENDISALSVIMKRSFDEDTRIHLNKEEGGPPGYDDGKFLRRWALHDDSTAAIVLLDSAPIGMYIVWIFQNNENTLGTIFIDSKYQNQGIGLKIWENIEKKYPDTKIWRTETPGFSKRNHHFYINKCGFSIVRIINAGDMLEESYILEKRY
ncbi:GNAT family N-acetyltransferase [Desulfovibrio inopinatus]|uniref:GNAT family N-acetyltransferase n=1 Tax=Desulfovibrio inopinatus TaxID=102109 RepID=UPI000489615D|nr:GNAT family N-acetyltransferase [Desulfovibrio inopinatus]